MNSASNHTIPSLFSLSPRSRQAAQPALRKSMESSRLRIVVLLLLLYSSICFTASTGTQVPAMYVFGDSLADVGNNNHLPLSPLKADFPHNGVDFPGRKATGRFSNGRNFPDFLAEKLGIRSPPPYLSLVPAATAAANVSATYLNGLNFASGGAGISSSTNQGQCVSMDKQVDYYSAVYRTLEQQLGTDQTLDHLSRSFFAVVVGGNDIINYVKSDSTNKLKNPPQQLLSSLVLTIQGQLTRLYNSGARKFMLIGTGPVGCCPALRGLSKTQECNAEGNSLSLQYNKALAALMENMSLQFCDITYSLLDTYSAMMLYIEEPESYGFAEVQTACCGLGDLNAKVACLPVSTLCADRTNHMFWDFFHPTEIIASLLTDLAFDGSLPYVAPVNVKLMMLSS